MTDVGRRRRVTTRGAQILPGAGAQLAARRAGGARERRAQPCQHPAQLHLGSEQRGAGCRTCRRTTCRSPVNWSRCWRAMPIGRARLNASCAHSRSPTRSRARASACGVIHQFHSPRAPAGFSSSSRCVLAPPALSKDAVPGRLKYRADHPFHLWVANEVVRRFPHRCCANVAELESTDFGITAEGLIREPRRYVKDDVRSIHDLGARILGWSTDAKIAVLRTRIADAETEAGQHGQAARAAAEAAESSRARAAAARDLIAIVEYSDIAPHKWSAEIVRQVGACRARRRFGGDRRP